jgi:hypothetical protein
MPHETPKSFNPLDKQNLAESIAIAIDRTPVHPLATPSFTAAGLYFLYYSGSFKAYARLVKLNGGGYHLPIYIGKGMPRGVRKGVAEDGKKAGQGRGIYSRLSNHAKSIRAAENLEIKDFHCRWLAMDEAFVHLGEILLISKFRPVWNVALDGFGNNPVGGPRSAGRRSAWDTVHPGRQGRATAPVDPERERKLLGAIREHLAATLPTQLSKT